MRPWLNLLRPSVLLMLLWIAVRYGVPYALGFRRPYLTGPYERQPTFGLRDLVPFIGITPLVLIAVLLVVNVGLLIGKLLGYPL